MKKDNTVAGQAIKYWLDVLLNGSDPATASHELRCWVALAADGKTYEIPETSQEAN